MLIQRNRALLAAVGVLMCGAPLLAWQVPWLWIPATLSFLAGIYLLGWATAGRGAWCRQCKSFGTWGSP